MVRPSYSPENDDHVGAMAFRGEGGGRGGEGREGEGRGGEGRGGGRRGREGREGEGKESGKESKF